MNRGTTPQPVAPAAPTDSASPTQALPAALSRRHWLGSMGAFVFGIGLGGCGGGGVGEEGTGAAPETVNVGVLTGLEDETLTVNNVEFDRAQAQELDGFDAPLTGRPLRLGMWVEVRGSFDEATGKGVARTVRVRNAARGVVTGVVSSAAGGSLDIEAYGVTVQLNAATVVDSLAAGQPFAVGDTVEVHGALAGAGAFAASRIERLANAPTPDKPFELRGRVSQLDTLNKTLLVGRRLVSYELANVTLRAGLADGMVVRVSAASAPPAANLPWVVTRLTADQPLPDTLGFLYTEGLVSSLVNVNGPQFLLEDLPVDARLAAGRGAVTSDGQRVAVVGALVKGVLIAKIVTVVQPGEPVRFTMSGQVNDFVSLADFKVRGVSVDASGPGVVFVAPTTAADVADGNRLRVTGTVQGRRLMAERVERLR